MEAKWKLYWSTLMLTVLLLANLFPEDANNDSKLSWVLYGAFVFWLVQSMFKAIRELAQERQYDEYRFYDWERDGL